MTKRLLSFFSYFGSKWLLAPKYPPPRYDMIVEPFAGSAQYSTLWWNRNIVLLEAYEVVANLWDYLIHVPESRILSLPDIGEKSVDDFDLSPPEKLLIGFWCNAATTHPCKTMSKWGRWGPRVRERIARQLPAIRHWTIIHTEFDGAPEIEATWYVDPPYQIAGKAYKHKVLDYQKLGDNCKNLSGQVIVCENEGATWLPFVPFHHVHGTSKTGYRRVSKEVIWCSP